jgi:hypothetical protein
LFPVLERLDLEGDPGRGRLRWAGTIACGAKTEGERGENERADADIRRCGMKMRGVDGAGFVRNAT